MQTASSTRQAILVLGMHRSGTSAVTRVISLLGADLPSNLMPPVKDNNEAGFWESMDVYCLNDEILAGAGSRWDDWRRFNPAWVRSPTKQAFNARVLALLERDFAGSSLFVLKDPRICRLLPFWLEVLADFGAETKCVLPIRNPLEVAASLRKRDGLSPVKSYMLWLRHVLDAERGSRGTQRAFVTYESMLEDWRGAVGTLSSALDIAWPRRSATAEVEIDRFLEYRHRHHAAGDTRVFEHADLSPWVKDTYAAVRELALASDSQEAQDRLDWVRAEVDRASDALGALMRAEEMAREELAQSSNERIAALEEEAASQADRVAELESVRARQDESVQALQAEMSERDGQVSTLSETLQARDAQITNLGQEVHDRAARISALENRVAQQEGQVAELADKVSERGADVARLTDEVSRREAEVTELRDRIGHHQARIAALEDDATKGEAQAIDLQERLHQREAMLAERDEELVEYRDEVAQRVAQVSDLEKRLAEREVQVGRLEGALVRGEARISDLLVRLSQQAEQVGDLGQKVAELEGFGATQDQRQANLETALFARDARIAALEADIALREVRAREWEEANTDSRARIAELSRAADRYRAQTTGLENQLAAAQDAKRALVATRNQALHRLDASQTSGSAQLMAPLRMLEVRWPRFVRGLAALPKIAWWTLGLRLPRRLRVRRLANELLSTRLFDRDWYVEQYPDVVFAGRNPALHWLATGWAEGRKPGPLFDTVWYREQNADAAEAGINPLEHYLRTGAAQGRQPHPLFDGAWYLTRYPDVAATGENPLAHFLRKGSAERRDPHPLFDSAWYVQVNGDVALSGVNPLIHYLDPDVVPARDPNPLFDTHWYFEQKPDLGHLHTSPLEHYLTVGASKGREPHPLFDGRWYLTQYPDIATSGENPLVHYLRIGAREKRDPHPLFDAGWYLAQVDGDAEASANPLVHYLSRGAQRGLDPNPLFDTDWYLERYPNVGKQGLNPLVHYVRWGADEGWDPGPRFETALYVEQNPEVTTDKVNPLAHCLRGGLRRDSRRLLPQRAEPQWEGPRQFPPANDREPQTSAPAPETDWEALVPICPDPKRLLVIDWKPPTPDKDSGSVRMSKILDCLSARGWEIDFIGDRDAGAPKYVESLERRGIRAIIGREAAVDHLARRGMEYRFAMLVRPEVFAKYAPFVRSFAVNAKVVYDTVDLHWVRFSRGAEIATDGAALAAQAESYKRLELANARSADVTVAITDDERRILLQEAPDLDVRIVPNIHEVAKRVPPFTERKDLFFIGGFDHKPNVDAVHYFVSEILPLVTRERPQIRFRVVGSNMPPEIGALASGSVEPIGYVEDVEPLFQQCRVFVAPLRHGAGMKGKVGHSLGFGLPVVTTPIGAEGIGLIDEENALICRDAPSFAAAVLRLYTDEDLWRRLSEAGRDLIGRKFSAEVVCNQLVSLVEG